MTTEKISVVAPANIAFVKYWGAADLEKALPLHPSISMTLGKALSHTTVEWTEGRDGEDEVWLATAQGALEPAPEAFRGRIVGHLERLRRRAGRLGSFRVATRNSFPAAAGLASSASGFAALSLAVGSVLGLETTPREASVLARLSGSGSASRSVMGGYVEWPVAGEDGLEGAAVQLAPAEHWALADVIALVETGAKEVSSLDGHRRAPSSPHFARRLELIPGRLEHVRDAILRRDLDELGPILEEEAIELHLIAMSSRPPIFYWRPATLAVLEAVRGLRRRGISAWSTMDAGANVHVICPEADAASVAEALAEVPGVVGVLVDGVGSGPARTDEELF
ncbi:MAG: diphosphomevalonate decarboxylase [Acidobacteria bacterium]|nr:diphosphomevalonate decarboxylase [Acidobacteriota bacterium]